jgi:adenylyltransferase/sulfurtransferase
MANAGGPSFSRGHVVVIGAGGLGCAVLPRLARMAIDRLTIVDGDRVEVHNLERQPLYDLMDVGAFKASTAAAWMRQIMASGNASGVNAFLDPTNARELLGAADVVVEGVDDLHAKKLIDGVCGEIGVPLVSGGVHRNQGQVIVLHSPGTGSELKRDLLFNGRPLVEQDGCDMREVSNELLEEVGRTMATRVRSILHGEPVVNGAIDHFDGRKWITLDHMR